MYFSVMYWLLKSFKSYYGLLKVLFTSHDNVQWAIGGVPTSSLI